MSPSSSPSSSSTSSLSSSSPPASAETDQEQPREEKLEELCHDVGRSVVVVDVDNKNDKKDVVKGSGRRKKSHPVRQIVNSCIVAYSDLPNSMSTSCIPVDLTIRADRSLEKMTSAVQELQQQQQQQQQQQPVILSVPHYNPAIDTNPCYSLPNTTITIRTPGTKRGIRWEKGK